MRPEDARMSSHSALLPLAAAAAHFGVSRADLRRAVERGELPAVRVGDRGLLFDAEEVETLSEASQTCASRSSERVKHLATRRRNQPAEPAH